ncbi:MAG: DUF1302 domain-containing protein [Xanthomonadales bacterium]|nr:DUF1302 domain-containing protein [Xanthomonadales bacterium]
MKTNSNHVVPRRSKARRRVLAGAVSAALFGLTAGGTASAFEISSGEFTANLDTTVSYGVSKRVEDRDPDLIGKANINPLTFTLNNAGQRAQLGRFSVNGDDGNLNYDDGDLFSNAIKFNSEFSWQYGANWGGLIRVLGFYDFENEGRDELSDLAKDKVGSDFQLLDFFVYHNFEFGEANSGSVRLGRQVVSWGESTFIQQGINVINPVDVSKLRIAGAELKEAFLPIDMIWGSLSFGENWSVEALYMFEFEQIEPDPSGTYFSDNDVAALGGQFVMLGFGTVNEPVSLAGCASPSSALEATSCSVAVPRLPDRYADDDGQYGIAVRYFSPELNNTEFGFYFLNYHSRVPLLSVVSVTNSNANSSRYFAEYPEDIRLYGLSFNTSLDAIGLAIQGELSYRDNVPLQIDDVELLFTALSPLNALIGAPGNRFISQLGTVGPNQEVRGWDRHEVSQLQFTFTKVFGPGNFLAAEQIAAIAEVGATKVWDLPDPSNLRYNGPGTDTGGGPDALTGALRNPETLTDGFATSFSWGYRMAMRADYSNAFGTPFTLSPRIAFNHDVSGTTPGPGGNFIEDRKSVTVGVLANYLNSWTADLSYTTFFGAGIFNTISDRDFVSFTAKYSF